MATPALILAAAFVSFYFHFAAITDRELREGAFGNSIDLYAAPVVFSRGDGVSPAELSEVLQQAGYALSSSSGPAPSASLAITRTSSPEIRNHQLACGFFSRTTR